MSNFFDTVTKWHMLTTKQQYCNRFPGVTIFVKSSFKKVDSAWNFVQSEQIQNYL